VDGGAVVFVEWGDVIDPLLPEDHLDVAISIPADEEGRALRLSSSNGVWGARWPVLATALARFGHGSEAGTAS
jgi:tRNA A37 threonylcarbamoyladenosine biosynthesis protein TsaE